MAKRTPKVLKNALTPEEEVAYERFIEEYAQILVDQVIWMREQKPQVNAEAAEPGPNNLNPGAEL